MCHLAWPRAFLQGLSLPRWSQWVGTMLLSLVVHTHSLRYWFPATIMLGTAPAYLLSWGVWRLMSTVLPARVYHRVDDRLYSIYQSMVLFFFENYTGVEASDPPPSR